MPQQPPNTDHSDKAKPLAEDRQGERQRARIHFGRPADAPVEPAPQMSLMGLMGGVAVISVALAVVRQFGIFGGIALFVVAVVLHVWFLAKRYPDPGLRRALDLVWGVGMPIVCLALDPIVLQQNNILADDLTGWHWQHNPANTTPYTFLGLQMAVLAIWLLWGKGCARYAAAISGVLSMGTVLALMVACLLTPFALIGIAFYGIGLLGFTPWMTSIVFLRHTNGAWRTAATLHGMPGALLRALLGAVAVIALTLAAWWAISFLDIPSGDSGFVLSTIPSIASLARQV